MPRRGLLHSLLTAALLCVQNVCADCECGYAVNATTAPRHGTYTDLIESDFLTIQNISQDGDWHAQDYTVAAGAGGPYGRNNSIANVISNPVADNGTLSGPGKQGGTAGLQLWVRAGQPGPGYLVPSAEISSDRTDMLYGSFRTAAKLGSVNGTCSAMFTFFNDTQEIDIEILSHQYLNGSHQAPLNLVVHSLHGAINSAPPNSSSYGNPVLGADLTNQFHEYRFDWAPGHVSFYFDGKWIWDLNDPSVPSTPAHMLLSHWSNGAKGWSQGPPDQDAVMTVSYFKAYFNSSDPQRARDFQGRCKDPSAPNAVCQIPDQTGAPDGNNAGTFFFSAQKNHTTNQTVFGGADQPSAATSALRGGSAGWAALAALCLAIPLYAGF